MTIRGYRITWDRIEAAANLAAIILTVVWAFNRDSNLEPITVLLAGIGNARLSLIRAFYAIVGDNTQLNLSVVPTHDRRLRRYTRAPIVLPVTQISTALRIFIAAFLTAFLTAWTWGMVLCAKFFADIQLSQTPVPVYLGDSDVPGPPWLLLVVKVFMVAWFIGATHAWLFISNYLVSTVRSLFENTSIEITRSDLRVVSDMFGRTTIRHYRRRLIIGVGGGPFVRFQYGDEIVLVGELPADNAERLTLDLRIALGVGDIPSLPARVPLSRIRDIATWIVRSVRSIANQR